MKWCIILFLLYVDGESENLDYDRIFDTAEDCTEWTQGGVFKAEASMIFETKGENLWMIQPLCKPIGKEV